MPQQLPHLAREWVVTGRVQGVGYRNFAATRALALGLTGWARNEADGSVRVYAAGPEADLDRLAGFLHMGPRMADVRGIEQREAPMQQLNSFRTE